MPDTISLYLVGVWLCVGLVTGFGWTIGAFVAAKITH